jgi:hypothetical protein
MSGCYCDSPKQLRITGEVYQNSQQSVGPGPKAVRVRCGSCGGKMGRIGSAVLTELFRIESSDIKQGRCLDPDEQTQIQVDLI